MTSIVLFLFGVVLGSFLNVCIDRIPRRQSIISPPSHCDSCGHSLSVVDLIPVLSYLFLRGRCRHCGAPVSWRMPVVEAATGLLFAACGWLVGWGAQLVPALVYSTILLLVTVIDLETQLIPDRIVLPAIPLVWAVSALWPVSDAAQTMLAVVDIRGNAVALSLLQSLAGGLVAFLVMLVPSILYPAGMGGGDVKLAAVIGLATGFPLSLLALFISFVAGGVIGGVLLLSGIKGRKDPIPFGPFLAGSGLLALFWGDALASWYWNSLSY